MNFDRPLRNRCTSWPDKVARMPSISASVMLVRSFGTALVLCDSDTNRREALSLQNEGY